MKEGLLNTVGDTKFIFYKQLGGDMVRLDILDDMPIETTPYKDYIIEDSYLNGDRKTYYIKPKKESFIKKTEVVVSHTEEVNTNGIQKQKKEIKDYLTDSLFLCESKHITVDYLDNNDTIDKGTIITEGFKIEGYKIKFSPLEGLCLSGYNLDYHYNRKYTSGKLEFIYNNLKDKFDVVPEFSTITDSTNATRITPFKFVESECHKYNVIDHLVITKDTVVRKTECESMDNIINPYSKLLN